MWTHQLEHQEAVVTLEVRGALSKPYTGVEIESVLLVSRHNQLLDVTQYLPASDLEIVQDNFSWEFEHGRIGDTLTAHEEFPLTVTVCADFCDGRDGKLAVLLGDADGQYVDIVDFCQLRIIDLWDEMLCEMKQIDLEQAHGDDHDFMRD